MLVKFLALHKLFQLFIPIFVIFNLILFSAYKIFYLSLYEKCFWKLRKGDDYRETDFSVTNEDSTTEGLALNDHTR